MRRGIEDLLVTRIIGNYERRRMPADEAAVRTALMPLPVVSYEEQEHREHYFATLLQTGTAFVLDMDDFPAIDGAYVDAAATPWDGLPPLPYQRIWIEFGRNDSRDPAPFYAPHDPRSEAVQWRLWGVAITGDEDRWHVFELMEWREPANELHVMAFGVNADGTMTWGRKMAEHDDSHEGRTTGWLPILLVQALDVLGSRHVALNVPRQHRRAHERRYGVEHPTVYFVDLRAAGDSGRGAGGREYRHRWMVRGHWRHLAAHGARTWVRPHVKGPSGAPWKGRPVYIEHGARGWQQRGNARG